VPPGTISETTGCFTMLEKIISGGRSGAEQAACRAARMFGVPSGGRMPSGLATEDGPNDEFAVPHGATELPLEVPTDQTEPYVQAADATLWFGATTTPSAQEAVASCHKFDKPCMLVYPDAKFEPWHVAKWITETRIATLNVAGNREAEEPGIGESVERFLEVVLQLLGHKRV
jgi:hypothetical protein